MLALSAFGFGGIAWSTADTQCVASNRVFAVDATTGKLHEIRACQIARRWELGPAVEVDRSDWRGYAAVFAVSDGDAAVLYAVTPTGELWWWRQDAPGAELGAPVRIGVDANWRHDVVFAAGPGVLAVGDFGTPVRTFRHDGWATGGTAVVEEGVLFTTFHGPVITALAPGSGYAVGTWEGIDYRVWRLPAQSGAAHDDVWYSSGSLPTGVSGATGDGTVLYGVNSGGEVVLLTQRQVVACRLANRSNWQVAARVPGHFGRVIVPAAAAAPPSVAAPPRMDPRLGPICGGGIYSPWEWQ